MTVAIVLLSYNGREDTVACLTSLRALDEPVTRIVLVDNGSTDGTPEAVAEEFPEVEVLPQTENLGFAEGNNVGIRHAIAAGAEWILIANNDTLFAPDTVTNMLAAATSSPDIGVVCPLILYADQPDRIWYAGRDFDARRGYHGRPHGFGDVDHGQFGGVRDVGTATGCAMLMPVAAIEEVGLMAPELFLYLEDIDWCLRFREAGFRVVVAGDARLWHRVSATGGGEHNPGIYYYGVRNTLEVCNRHAPLHGLRGARRTAETLIAYTVFVRRAQHKAKSLRAIAEGFRDQRARRLGPRGAA